METEKSGGLQSEPIEQTDVAPEVVKEVEATPEPPKEDEVQKWEPFKQLISEREKAAEEKAAKHFQSVKDREVAAEKRGRLEAERNLKMVEARVEGLQETFLAGLDPEQRAEAQRRSDAKVAQRKAELDRPSPEMLQEVQRMNQFADDAKFNLRLLKHQYGISYDMSKLTCSNPEVDLTNPETAFNTTEALIAKLKSGTKAVAEEPKKETKKAPKVDEGGVRTSGKREYTREEIANMNVTEYAKLQKDINEARKEGRIK